jgi:hypothetical protein
LADLLDVSCHSADFFFMRASQDTATCAVLPSAHQLRCSTPRNGIRITSLDTSGINSESKAVWQAVTELANAAGPDIQYLRCVAGKTTVDWPRTHLADRDILSTHPGSGRATRALGSMLQAASQLQTLVLECAEVNVCELALIWRDSPAATQSLRELELRDLRPGSAKQMQECDSFLPPLPSLQILRWTATPEGDLAECEFVVHPDLSLALPLSRNLLASTGLHTLQLEQLGCCDWTQLQPLLAAVPALKELKITEADMEFGVATELSGNAPIPDGCDAALRQLTQLTHLQLHVDGIHVDAYESNLRGSGSDADPDADP